MLDSLLRWYHVSAGTSLNADAVRYRAGDDDRSRLAVNQRGSSDDTAGRLNLQTVGPGVQTLHDDGSLIAYIGIQVSSPTHVRYAFENGGASIVSQREDRLEIESGDGRFPKICRATTSWFLDGIHVAGGAIQCSENVFRGVGGPVTMSDGTLALAYISGIEWSTRHAIRRWADEEVRRRKLRGAALREFKQEMLSGSTRGKIALNLDVRFYPGQPDLVPEEFHGGDYHKCRFLLSPVELAHKPFTVSIPAVWRQEFTSLAQANVCVAWDFCDPVNPLIAVAGSGLTSGPQRLGREPHRDADIWVFGKEGR